MIALLRPAVSLIAVFTLLTGIALPLLFVGGATALDPYAADGSLVRRDGHVIGSALIGQYFSTPRYFHPRPSATTTTDAAGKTVDAPYDADASGGSNLAPTSKALIDRVRAAIPADGPKPVPADMVTTSGSGLDPDISPEDAERQVARVAATRHLPPATVASLVRAHTAGRLLGFIGEPRVNVLALNLALDQASGAP